MIQNLFMTAGIALLLPSILQPQELPWKERSEFVWTGAAPTTADRLLDAEVLIVPTENLTLLPSGDYELLVLPWEYLNGTDTGFPLCEEEAFFGQPSTSILLPGTFILGCSGFLVGPQRVVTAGHCIGPNPGALGSQTPYSCSTRSMIFDVADLGPLDPGETTIIVPGNDVVQCDEVEVDTTTGAEVDLLDATPKIDDWALARLTTPVSRLPLVIDRDPRTQIGEPLVAIGHPARIPVKIEGTVAEGATEAKLHVLGGNSGSALLSLETGKVIWNISSVGNSDFITIQGCPDCCADLCFECEGALAKGTNSALWASQVDPIGLQVANATAPAIEFFGPPTVPSEFETRSIGLSLPDDSLPPLIQNLEWEASEDGNAGDFEVAQGPTSGTLLEGESEDLGLLPTLAALSTPGLVEGVMSLYDYTYETRFPVRLLAHVGIDSFTFSPGSNWSGEGELGEPHGSVRNLTFDSRWVPPQALQVEALPQVSWLHDDVGADFDIESFPLPGKYSGVPDFQLNLTLDGTGLSPGTYVTQLRFTALDSGVPNYVEEREVVLDHCREVHPAGSATIVVPASGGIGSVPFDISPNSGTVIEDVDIVLKLSEAAALGGGFKRPFLVRVIAPDGTPVVLKDFQETLLNYYDEDRLTPEVLLDNLESLSSDGLWHLEVENSTPAPERTFKMKRWDVRLHHVGAANCQ